MLQFVIFLKIKIIFIEKGKELLSDTWKTVFLNFVNYHFKKC